MKNKAFNIILIILLVAVIALCVYLLVWDIMLTVDYIVNDHVLVLDMFYMTSFSETIGIDSLESFYWYYNKLLFLQSSTWMRFPVYGVSILSSLFFITKALDRLVGGKFSDYMRNKTEPGRIRREEKAKLKKQIRTEIKKQKLIKKLKKLEEDS